MLSEDATAASNARPRIANTALMLQPNIRHPPHASVAVLLEVRAKRMQALRPKCGGLEKDERGEWPWQRRRAACVATPLE